MRLSLTGQSAQVRTHNAPIPPPPENLLSSNKQAIGFTFLTGEIPCGRRGRCGGLSRAVRRISVMPSSPDQRRLMLAQATLTERATSFPHGRGMTEGLGTVVNDEGAGSSDPAPSGCAPRLGG